MTLPSSLKNEAEQAALSERNTFLTGVQWLYKHLSEKPEDELKYKPDFWIKIHDLKSENAALSEKVKELEEKLQDYQRIECVACGNRTCTPVGMKLLQRITELTSALELSVKADDGTGRVHYSEFQEARDKALSKETK